MFVYIGLKCLHTVVTPHFIVLAYDNVKLRWKMWRGVGGGGGGGEKQMLTSTNNPALICQTYKLDM